MRGSVKLGGALAAVALVASVVASGATAGAAAKPTGPPIKLMTIFEKSAGIGNPDTADGAIAAAKAITKAGGLGGRPVQVIVCDTANDPNKAADCGRQAVDQGVVALVGNLSIYSAQFMPLMVQNKIPSIGLNPAGAADFTSEAAFPITGGAVATFGTLPRSLAKQGAKKVSMVRPDLAAGAALKIFANGALKTVGQEIVNDVPVPSGAPDMSSYVAAATANGTDAIVVGLSGDDALNFVIAALQSNPDLKLALISTDLAKTTKALGKQADGILLANAFFDAKEAKAANKAYDKAMKAAKFKKGASELSYAAVQVFAALAKDLPDITGPAVYDKLPTVTGLSIGLLPPLQFQKGGGGGIPRVFNTCERTTQIKGKKTVQVQGMTDPYTGTPCPAAG